MPWYYSTYQPRIDLPEEKRFGKFESAIHADSVEEARDYADLRNIGERLEDVRPFNKHPYQPPSEMLIREGELDRAEVLRAIHATTFLSYLLMQSKQLHPAQIVGDQGLLHEVVHHLELGDPKRHEIVEMLREHERLVPGYFPSHTEVIS